MTLPEPQHLTVEETARNLAGFAIDRTDLKQIMTSLPRESGLNLTTIEYELGILKILTVGWGISFFMPKNDKNKPLLAENFWHMVQEFSHNISLLTETATGQPVNYFDILKQRLDTYVGQMQIGQEDVVDPAAVMGPAFAKACKSPDNAIAILIGSKMFSLTLGAVKEYLAAVTIKPVTLN